MGDEVAEPAPGIKDRQRGGVFEEGHPTPSSPPKRSEGALYIIHDFLTVCHCKYSDIEQLSS